MEHIGQARHQIDEWTTSAAVARYSLSGQKASVVSWRHVQKKKTETIKPMSGQKEGKRRSCSPDEGADEVAIMCLMSSRISARMAEAFACEVGLLTSAVCCVSRFFTFGESAQRLRPEPVRAPAAEEPFLNYRERGA